MRMTMAVVRADKRALAVWVRIVLGEGQAMQRVVGRGGMFGWEVGKDGDIEQLLAQGGVAAGRPRDRAPC